MTLQDCVLHLNCLHLLELPPREFHKNSRASMVWQMVSDNIHDVNVDVVSAVAASESSSAHHCLMCNSTVHLFNACPKVSDLSSNTRCIVFSSLLQALDVAHSHSCPGPIACNAKSHVHAIMTEVNTISDDVSAPADSSSHMHNDDIDAHPDFQ